MKQLFSLCVLMSFLLSASAQHKLVKKWESDSTLKVPESVLYDASAKLLYVSNIDGEPWGKDGKGSIGKLSTDGKIIAADWVTGFHCPKGMVMHQGKLYVADLNAVRIVDLKKGVIVDSIVVDGAQGLNDITSDNKDNLYVTDSRLKRVYRISGGNPQLYLDTLKGPNGILYHNDILYVLDAGGMYEVKGPRNLVKIAEGMDGGIDGIENVQGKDFIISCWQGTLWYVNADGSKELLLDTRNEKINAADIGYDRMSKTVYVPTFFKNSVVAYEVK